MRLDPRVQQRAHELINEAQVTLDAIRRLGAQDSGDPFTDPATLARAVTSGVLDAPHLRNNAFARGQIITRIDGRGANVAVGAIGGRPLPEAERLASFL